MYPFLVSFCVIFFFPKTSYGYIDPGTGSLIIQIIVGFVLSIGLGVKIFWSKIKAFFSKTSKKTKSESLEGGEQVLNENAGK